MTRRYAIYHAPVPDTVWWRFGAHWLGRDERTGAALPQAIPPQWTAEELERHGYPHVMERFRFHMTLSGPVDTGWAGRIVAQVARPVHQVNVEQPPVLDRLCVFVEPEPDAAFLRIADAPLQP